MKKKERKEVFDLIKKGSNERNSPITRTFLDVESKATF